MENIPIIGGTPEDKKTAQGNLEETAEEMKTSMWGIEEKTAEQLKWIDMVNIFIDQEMKRLGLEFIPIEKEQIRFLKDSFSWKYATMTPSGDDAQGRHHLIHRTISINEEKIKEHAEGKAVDVRLKEFAVLLHEAIHERGHIKFDLRSGDLEAYRKGYELVGEEAKLQGFNEGVIELITARLMDLHKDEIKNEFGVDLNTEEDENDKNNVWNYINRRDTAWLAINVYNGDFDTLWRGYFTGDMMHLRNIERKYGKGALKILSLLDDGEEDGGREKIIAIHTYFNPDTTPEEREEIKNRLLGE